MKNYMLYTYDLQGNDDSNSDCYFCDNKLEIGTLNILSSTICPTYDTQDLSVLKHHNHGNETMMQRRIQMMGKFLQTKWIVTENMKYHTIFINN
jgi:hypothetical protein